MDLEEFAAKVAAKLCRPCQQYKPVYDSELNRYRHNVGFCNAGAVWKTLEEIKDDRRESNISRPP